MIRTEILRRRQLHRRIRQAVAERRIVAALDVHELSVPADEEPAAPVSACPR